MKINFTKMEGIGNDYVYVDCTSLSLPDESGAAKKLSDRHFGIGADGLILIKKCDIADFEMVMYNADGSRSEMCGNGIRCVAKFAYDKGLTDKRVFTVASMGKVKLIKLLFDGEKVVGASVDMGKPVFKPSEIPVNAQGDEAFGLIAEALGEEYSLNCVSMGNPHAVIFVDEITDRLVLEVGKELEFNPVFPNRANIEFAKVNDAQHIEMRVWERGTGETLACGTGACATAAAAIKKGLCGKTVTITLPGGELVIALKDDGQLNLTGPATTVFEGTVEI